jgi:hypothetical protein
MTHPFPGGDADVCASRNCFAQSSQQTSTVLPPTFTLIEFASSLLSHAAQVFSVI